MLSASTLKDVFSGSMKVPRRLAVDYINGASHLAGVPVATVQHNGILTPQAVQSLIQESLLDMNHSADSFAIEYVDGETHIFVPLHPAKDEGDKDRFLRAIGLE